MRDFFAIARFLIPNLGQKADPQKLPPDFPKFLGAVLRGVGNNILKRDTGLTKSIADKMLPSIVQKLVKNSDGTFAVPAGCGPKETALINCLCSYLISKPAFNDDRLFDDLTATLKSHGLLRKAELREFSRLKPGITLYAVSIMHNCTIRLEDDTFARLFAGRISPDDKIAVLASSPVTPAGKSTPINFVSPLFATSLIATAHCEPPLLQMGKPDGAWQGVELEVTPKMTLAQLV